MKQPYDEHAEFYLEFVDRQLSAPEGLWNLLLRKFDELIGPRIADANVCDLGCGDGYLARHLAHRGARHVLGIDISTRMIEAARERTDDARVEFVIGDVQDLEGLSDGSFDIAVSQLALMDIPDHRKMFRSVRRALNDSSVFVFSLLHPLTCSPFSYPDEAQLMLDEGGTPVAGVIRRYATEGHWQSGGEGVRGRVGSYHRTLSTYVNDLIDAGFRIQRLLEPVLPGEGFAAEVPQVLMVAAIADA